MRCRLALVFVLHPLLLLGMSCSPNGHARSPGGDSGEVGEDPGFVTSLEDTDGDGLPNYLETRIGSDPRDYHDPYRYGFLDFENLWGPAGDGIVDGLERFLVDGGARPPVKLTSDTDLDGIPDYFEVRYGPDPFKPWDPLKKGGRDRDDTFGPPGDGISDALETLIVSLGGAAPVTRWSSSDSDAVPDYVEVFLGTDPFDSEDAPNIESDHDGDGLPTYLEIDLGSAPYDPDAPYADGRGDRDQDGLPNGLEDYLSELVGYPPDGADYTADFDRDGIPDAHELLMAHSAPEDPDDPALDGALDRDDDLLPDGLEEYVAMLGGSDPSAIRRSTDFDHDGLPAVLEVTVPDGLPADANRPLPKGDRDDDEDGVSDAVEDYLAHLGGFPPIIMPVTATSDSDGDGRADGAEVAGGFDPQAIDLARYADEILPNVITFDHNGQYLNNTEVRFVALRALSTQASRDSAMVNLHEVRFRDSIGRLLPVNRMSFVTATPYHTDSSRHAPWIVTGAHLPDSHGPASLFDGALIDRSDPDPSRWPAANSSTAEGMYQATDRAPFAYVIIDLGADYDLRDMLVWNGLQKPGRAVDKLQVELFQAGLDFDYPGGPAGIEPADGTGDLSLWFRADRGTSTHWDGDLVDYWNDLSGYARHAAAQGSDRPRFLAATPANGRPAIDFALDGMVFDRPPAGDLTIMVEAASTQADEGDWLETDGSFLGISMSDCPGVMGMGFNAGKLYWADCSMIQSNADVNDGSPHILTATRNQQALRVHLFIDGLHDRVAPSSGDSLDASETWGLGQLIDGGRLIGQIWEVAIFSRILGATERNLIDNAFSSRYATPISNDHFFLDSTHGDEVCGLGRRSAGDEVLGARGADYLEIFSPTNLDDGDWLLWGTDRVDPFSTSFDVPLHFDRRLRQTWAFQETDGGAGDGVGLVDIRFYLDRIDPQPANRRYALLVDDDLGFADPRLVVEGPEHDPEAGTITFTGVRLGAQGYLALAIRDP